MRAQVLIFDFDVHHGNGTNDMFYDDPSVLFISTHQSGLYPGTGKLSEVGTGDGEGASINLPLPGALIATTFRRVASAMHAPTNKVQYDAGSSLLKATKAADIAL